MLHLPRYLNNCHYEYYSAENEKNGYHQKCEYSELREGERQWRSEVKYIEYDN